jgi:hypothetical protein
MRDQNPRDGYRKESRNNKAPRTVGLIRYSLRIYEI